MIQTLIDYSNYILAAAVFVSTLFSVFLFSLPTSYDPSLPDTVERNTPSEKQNGKKDSITVRTSVQVVVLGDIGRSPRMQYHAISIAKHGGRVDLIGYQESEVHPEISSSPLIRIVAIPAAPKQLQTGNKLLFLLFAPLKVLWQVWSLYRALGYRTKPARWMLVQNPPSIPTLAVAQFVCLVRNTRLVVDWHNFGYSILALKLGQAHPLVRISKWYEFLFSCLTTDHLTVTNAMARKLWNDFGITAQSLHDRPPAHFQPLSSEQRSALLARLPKTAQHVEDLETGAWKLIVSSTSWTADEDFSILLDALVGYSAAVTEGTKLPKILAIITGKGPQKEHYETRIKALNQENKLSHVLICTAWLSTEDYASLLGAANLGVSLHTSSSGVDLPMKVVDMFGTGLPVVGWSEFEAWPELVTEGVNGRGFASAAQLQALLVELFSGSGNRLQRLRQGALQECNRRWDDEWNPVAGRLFRLTE